MTGPHSAGLKIRRCASLLTAIYGGGRMTTDLSYGTWGKRLLDGRDSYYGSQDRKRRAVWLADKLSALGVFKTSFSNTANAS